MAESVFGFLKSVQTSGSGVTDAIRRYNLFLEQGANEQGVISDPNVYMEGRKILEPYADDVRVQVKVADSINDENKLKDRISDVNLVRSAFEEDVSNALHNYSKAYYQSPSDLVFSTSYVYNLAVDELADEIETRRVNAEPIGELQTLLNKYEGKARDATRLTNLVLSDQVKSAPQAWGWFVQTNPEDGSIVSMRVDAAAASDTSGAFKRTDSTYDGIPVWVNTVLNAEGDKEVARIGINEYEFDDGDKQLKLQGKNWGKSDWKALWPGGTTPSEAKTARGEVNLSNLTFGDALNLPQGSVARDVKGNYYYYSPEGVYKSEDKGSMQKFLAGAGQQVPDVDQIAYQITREQVNSFGSFTNEDGTSRIIDENFLGGVTNATTTPQAGVPTVDQQVRGSATTTPQPVAPQPAPQEQQGFQVPRKEPEISTEQRETVGGKTSAADVISKEQEKVVQNNPLTPFKNFFGGLKFPTT